MDGRALPPLFLVLELTYRCNLACPFCFVRRQPKTNTESNETELTPQEIERVVGQTPPWTIMLLSGGEPFVRNDISDILQCVARKRRCHIFTNGTAITPLLVEKLVKLGVASIAISVEGSEPVHDAIRGPGTWTRACDAIRMLSAEKGRRGSKFPLVTLKTTITASNVEFLSDVVGIADKLGANYCNFQILNNSVQFGGVFLQQALDYCTPPPPISGFPLDRLEQQLNLIRSLRSKSRVRIGILPDLPTQTILAHYGNRFPLREHQCRSPWAVMYVSPAGDVYPCLNYRVGSVRKGSLYSFWNNHAYRQFRLHLLQNGLFSQCSGCCDVRPKQ
jgi:MoaA/NifB/PqqE/SkfB family radical SAM enzyme